MKHLKNINELFGNLFHKDEKTAQGILAELNKINVLDITKQEGGFYLLTIDGFDIKSKRFFSLKSGNNHYYLKIDDFDIDCSNSIKSKIYNRILEIYNRHEIEMKEYTKKDARIHFSKK
jgi:hypothetical protein